MIYETILYFEFLSMAGSWNIEGANQPDKKYFSRLFLLVFHNNTLSAVSLAFSSYPSVFF
jgi:hypothetical protein